MDRRRFLRSALALGAIAPVLPLLPKALEWREGAGLYRGAEKVYPEVLTIHTTRWHTLEQGMALHHSGLIPRNVLLMDFDMTDEFVAS